jgi:thiamine biosynthesis lipoprotein
MRKWIALGFALIAALVLLLMPDRDKLQYYHNQGNIFGTYYSIKYEATEDLHHVIQSALQAVDNSLSMFNANSVISKVNRNDSIILDSLFITMYKEAVEISKLSNGAFDITVAPMVHAWGFGKNAGQKKESTDINIDSLKQFVGYNKIDLHNKQIIKQDPRTTLDASAIAKGYGCDVVANALRAKGCKNLLVDIGGEVVLEGLNQEGNAWRVGISKPKKDANGTESSLQKIIESTNLCMATSGNYLQYYYVGNQRRSHTIDPRSGYPVEHSLLSATVIANSCMRADALATACMTLGAEDAVEMIEKTDDAACYLIVAEQDSLRIMTSTRWDF